MRLLVCGGRDFTDRAGLFARLDQFVEEDGRPDVVIHGGARGADRLAGEWAREHGIKELVFYAEWRRWGNAAGPIRNSMMISFGRPTHALVFPGGRGTADMAHKLLAAKTITVIDMRWTNPASSWSR